MYRKFNKKFKPKYEHVKYSRVGFNVFSKQRHVHCTVFRYLGELSVPVSDVEIGRYKRCTTCINLFLTSRNHVSNHSRLNTQLHIFSFNFEFLSS